MGTLDDLPDEGPQDLNLNTNNKEEETKFNWKIFAYNNFWISLVKRDRQNLASNLKYFHLLFKTMLTVRILNAFLYKTNDWQEE